MDKDALNAKIVDALKTIYDPEIPVSIYELGLVYDIQIDDHGNVDIAMTLTTPACPEAQAMPVHVRQGTEVIEGVNSVRVEVVWEPPWGPDRMSEAARLMLGF
ncbi:MAG: DUF59 domain-containing protein [Deltaproteobacteria bacterium]|nr:DUF59 domain-containing protein [Deltaproteobacteria bacterium]